MDELWYMYIKKRVFDKIKKKSLPYLEEKYTDVNFTSQEVTETPSKFPCIEIIELPGIENGNTLKNDEVAGYIATFQVNVYSEKGDSVAWDVMGEVISHFKKDLMFSIVATPTTTKIGGITRYTARCRREIGAGDTI